MLSGLCLAFQATSTPQCSKHLLLPRILLPGDGSLPQRPLRSPSRQVPQHSKPAARVPDQSLHLSRVQFDRRELGVELIRDVDVMPCNPTHNLPVSMLPQHRHLVRFQV